ncbi:MAG: RraA family protein [Chloroflexi bacterium]|nr:RraA family protein [Chloroflexota bacterium]
MPNQYNHEEVLLFCGRLEKTYTPAAADVLDDMGFMHQSMESGFVSIITDAVVAGPAYTIEEARTRKSTKLAEYDPAFVAQALSAVFGSMQKGQVIAVSTNGFWGAGAFGELMATTSKYVGGVKAAVVDGPVRDIRRTLEIGFPVWARGNIPTDSIGRTDLVGVGSPIYCGGVTVKPGDIIFADRDGVVVIPVQDVDLEEVVVKAEEIVAAERRSRQEIRNGMSLLDVYKKYGKL